MRIKQAQNSEVVHVSVSRFLSNWQIVFATAFACSALPVSTDYVIIKLTTVEFYRLYINLYSTLLRKTFEMKTKQFTWTLMLYKSMFTNPSIRVRHLWSFRLLSSVLIFCNKYRQFWDNLPFDLLVNGGGFIYRRYLFEHFLEQKCTYLNSAEPFTFCAP